MAKYAVYTMTQMTAAYTCYGYTYAYLGGKGRKK